MAPRFPPTHIAVAVGIGIVLLGTIMPKNADALLNAIIQATAGNKIYIISTGDKLNANITITNIQAKQVTLEKAGQQRTLKLNPRPLLK